jgi:hypothetical protein
MDISSVMVENGKVGVNCEVTTSGKYLWFFELSRRTIHCARVIGFAMVNFTNMHMEPPLYHITSCCRTLNNLKYLDKDLER